MKIPINSLFNNIAHFTIQIPQISYNCTIDPAGGPPTFTEPTMVDIPDDWVILLRGNRPCVGKETGFLYFTRKGYNANLDEIKKIWESTGQEWAKFEEMVESHFKAVEKAANKFVLELKKKLMQAETLLTKL